MSRLSQPARVALDKFCTFLAGGIVAAVLIGMFALVQHEDEIAAQHVQAQVMACSQVMDSCRIVVRQSEVQK